MIWPVSDCDQPVELLVMNNYHRFPDPRGYLVVQTPAYYACWESLRPDMMWLRAPSGEGPDWIEWKLDADLLTPDGASALGEPKGPWKLTTEVKARTPVRGNRAESSWARDYANGSVVLRMVFTPDAVTQRVEFDMPGATKVQQLQIARGTRLRADLAFDPQPEVSGWFYGPLHALRRHSQAWLTPSPFARCFRQPDGKWLVAAVEAPVEELSFIDFHAVGAADESVTFRFDYTEFPLKDGRITSPAIAWRFGFSDEFAALEGHAEAMFTSGLAERPRHTLPDWHREPIICGWHRQVELATNFKEKGEKPAYLAESGFETGVPNSQAFAREDVYEEHLALFEQVGIPVHTVILDTNWAYSESDWRPDPAKWPDLPAFIRRQHDKGRHVLLWISPLAHDWPDDECYSFADQPNPRWRKAIDPMNPKWRRHLRDLFEHLLSAKNGGCDADGLKLDYTGPLAAEFQARGVPDRLWGFRHLYELMRAISETARAVKPDCLLNFQSAHPQFAHLHGMTRLNDFFLPQRQAVRVMRTRSRIARAVNPGSLVDTDAPAGLEYLRNSSGFGNQSLYLTHEQLNDPRIVAAVKDGRSGVGLSRS